MVRAEWLLQRLSRLEAELWTHEIEAARQSSFNQLDEDAPIGDIYGRTHERFTRLQRRIDSAERSYYRALTQLQRLRREGDYEAGPAGELEPECPPSEPAPVSDPQAAAPAPERTNPISTPLASHPTDRSPAPAGTAGSEPAIYLDLPAESLTLNAR